MHVELEPTSPSWAVTDTRAAAIGDRGRVVAGVASATSDIIGVEPLLVRLAFVVLAVAGGWGILIYGALWATFTLIRRPDAVRRIPRPPTPARDLGFGVVVVGLVLESRSFDVAFNDAVVWPLLVIAIGVGVVGRRVGEVAVGAAAAADDSRHPWLRTARVVGGVGLVLGGALAFGGSDITFSIWLRMVLALVIVLVGVYLLLGPTLRTMGDALMSERRQRIRSDERALISSHLHDSVLQTLALIQRRSGDSIEVAALARHQERELRQWLYGETRPNEGTIRGAFELSAAEVEDLHRLVVECVVVGDEPLDERGSAVVGAAREAMVNAAKFSGEQRISLFAEIADGRVDVFVRDRGQGFDLEEVPSDRRGIADSIFGRMDRVGGSASVRSTRREGTEVHLVLPPVGAAR